MTTIRTKPLKRHLAMIQRLSHHPNGITIPLWADEHVLREMQMEFEVPLVEYSSDSERGFHGWRLTSAGRAVQEQARSC